MAENTRTELSTALAEIASGLDLDVDRTNLVGGEAGALRVPEAAAVPAPTQETQSAPAATPEAHTPPFTFSDGLRAAHAQWLAGVQQLNARTASLQLSAARLADLEQLSPVSAMKRREELAAAEQEVGQFGMRLMTYAQQLEAAAIAEVQQSILKLIPEWATAETRERETAAMIAHARDLGLDDRAIDAVAWNPLAIVRFRDAWMKTRAVAQTKLKPIRGGKHPKADEPVKATGNGVLRVEHLERAREILRKAGVR